MRMSKTLEMKSVKSPHSLQQQLQPRILHLDDIMGSSLFFLSGGVPAVYFPNIDCAVPGHGNITYELLNQTLSSVWMAFFDVLWAKG